MTPAPPDREPRRPRRRWLRRTIRSCVRAREVRATLKAADQLHGLLAGLPSRQRRTLAECRRSLSVQTTGHQQDCGGRTRAINNDFAATRSASAVSDAPSDAPDSKLRNQAAAKETTIFRGVSIWINGLVGCGMSNLQLIEMVQSCARPLLAMRLMLQERRRMAAQLQPTRHHAHDQRQRAQCEQVRAFVRLRTCCALAIPRAGFPPCRALSLHRQDAQ